MVLIVTNYLFDLLLNAIQVIFHVNSLDAQASDARYEN